MSQTDHAARWHSAMKDARALDPQRIVRDILATADNGLRAARYDAQGGRTSFVPCTEPERCDEGPGDHSHMVSSDPTGNAAVNRPRGDTSAQDIHHVEVARKAFIASAAEVLDFVCGERPTTWAAIRLRNAKLGPGTIQAGIDVDHERLLPHHIDRVVKAVKALKGAAGMYSPRKPSVDDQHWTAGLSDNDVCAWHLAVHRRYRRPRVSGTNICGDCQSLALLLGQRPPAWLLEAEVDREGKPKAWQQALGRCMDELGVAREAG